MMSILLGMSKHYAYLKIVLPRRISTRLTQEHCPSTFTIPFAVNDGPQPAASRPHRYGPKYR